MINKSEWERFLNGHWQKEMPQKEGTYPIHARDCPTSIDSTDSVVRNKDGKLFSARHLPYCSKLKLHVFDGTTWKGWWWSEPFPELPPPPEWNENE